MFNRIFAYQEVKGVKEVKELRRMSCCLKNYAKKTVVLTPPSNLTSESRAMVIHPRRLRDCRLQQMGCRRPERYRRHLMECYRHPERCRRPTE